MHNRRWGQWLLFLSISFFVLLGSGRIRAQAPTNVGLRFFTATPQADGVRLDWATETELGTAGFIIKRSPGTSETFVTLDAIGFVPGQGGVATGATYSRVDETAIYGQTYTYKLVEIETDSDEIDLESVTITFIVIPTATPVVIGGNDNNTLPTKTPPPTSTPAASTTPTNTAVSPTTTVTSSNSTKAPQPTAAAQNIANPQATPTNRAVLDTTFSGDTAGVQPVFAQEPNETAYPGQATLSPDTTFDSNNDTNPDNPMPLPSNSTPHPFGPDSDAPPTIAVIGSQEERQPDEPISPANTDEATRGRIFLWAGFIIALLVFITGVAGSIVLYRRS